MKRNRMFAALLAALLLITCLLGGCGKPEPDLPDPPPPAPAAPKEPALPPEVPAEEEPVEEEPAEEEALQETQTPQDESLQDLRLDMEPSAAIGGIMYLGYWEEPLNSDFFATLDPQALLGRFGFLSQIPPERLIANDGYEIYCIIPADPNASVTVTQWLELEENDYAPGPGETLYEGGGEPFLLQANVSDILPNAAITITNSCGETLEAYQPQISLRDGTVTLPGEDQPILLDYTEYALPPLEEEEGPACTSYDLYVPNEAADDFDLIYLEDQLLGANYVLSMLVDYGVLPENLQFNSFSEDGMDLYLDLGSSFQAYLSNLGTTGELLTLGSLVNSFLSAFGADTITITVDGQALETGHNIYDEPFTFISVSE